MKLHEIELPRFYIPTDKKKRLARLKALVDSGSKPDVHDAGFIWDKFTFGDLEEIGYADRHYYERGSPDEGNFFWVYTGPKPVELVQNVHHRPSGTLTTNRREIHAGERTDYYND